MSASRFTLRVDITLLLHGLIMHGLATRMYLSPTRRAGERKIPRCLFALAAMAAAVSTISSHAHADRIQNGVAVLAALDKVTGRVSPLEIPINETVEFGALKVTPRVCYTRPPTEPPLTSAFLEVEEVVLDGAVKRIFTGWMFAQSPGLHAVEHPTFDVWLTSCKIPAEGRSGGRRSNSPRP